MTSDGRDDRPSAHQMPVGFSHGHRVLARPGSRRGTAEKLTTDEDEASPEHVARHAAKASRATRKLVRAIVVALLRFIAGVHIDHARMSCALITMSLEHRCWTGACLGCSSSPAGFSPGSLPARRRLSAVRARSGSRGGGQPDLSAENTLSGRDGVA